MSAAAVGSCFGQIRRERSRLRMHAPSSILVEQPSGSLAEWKVAIPLLSPLDISSMPLIGDLRPPKMSPDAGESAAAAVGYVGGVWRHPAEPFYYEPVPVNAPAFAVPHCTG